VIRLYLYEHPWRPLSSNSGARRCEADVCTARGPLLTPERHIGVSGTDRPHAFELHPATTWPKEIPQDQTQQRQEHHY